MSNVNYRGRNYGYNAMIAQVAYKSKTGFSLYANVSYWGSFGEEVSTSNTVNKIRRIVKKTKNTRAGVITTYDTIITSYNSMTNRWTQTTLGISYEKALGEHFYVGASYERWFLTNGNSSEKNAMNNFLAADVSYSNQYFNIKTGLYYILVD